MKKKICGTRKSKGQSLVETMTAFFILLPIGLAGLDIATLVSATQQNEGLAETASRSASFGVDQKSAQLRAEEAVEGFQTGVIVKSVAVDKLNFDLGKGTVSVTTVAEVKLPVPFPFFNEVTCRATSLQPIVSTRADR